jgi:hypothetical protein
MRKVKYLLSNINLLNIMLALLLILLANYMVWPFLRMNTAFTLPPVKKPALEKIVLDEKTSEEKSPSPSDYTVIAEQNLFHPERIIPVSKATAETSLPKPEFVLYGTLVTDGLRIAYMEDKKAKENKDTRKKQTALRIGDRLSGFLLVEVDNDKVVMKRAGEEGIVVSLNEPKVRETPVTAAPAPAKTVPGRGGQASALAPQTRDRGMAASRRQRNAAEREVSQRERPIRPIIPRTPGATGARPVVGPSGVSNVKSAPPPSQLPSGNNLFFGTRGQ